MYKFIITHKLKPGALDAIREAAKPCQAATRAEPNNISYDFFVSIDDPDLMVFVECFETQQDHAWHAEQPYVKAFLEAVEPLLVESSFETIDVAE